MPAKTTKEVISAFPEEIRNRYDFSEAVYVSALKPISNIKCYKHGLFSQYSAQLRKNGAGCPACGSEKRVQSQRLSKKDFVEKVKAIHGDKYDYTKTNFIKMNKKIVVTCGHHGDFIISPSKHLYSGQGCPECGAKLRGKRKSSKNVGAAAAKTSIAKHRKAFSKKAKKVHGDRYDYSESYYTGKKAKVTIICQTHGKFEQSAEGHLYGAGCPQCSHHLSKQENVIQSLCSIFTTTDQRNRSTIAPKELDIYLPEHKLGIEYCGMYWHSHKNREDERNNKLRHFEKYKLCEEKGIRLLTVFESDWVQNPQAIKRLIRNAIGKSKGRLMARKCDLKKVDTKEASEFYNKYHPQGGNGSGEHYGLWWNDKLVACMRFTFGANDRGLNAKNRTWTLTRYATRLTVSGAASRLFKAFIREHQPDEVKSFSDNRYFTGAMYSQLGFKLAENMAPDYQVWSPKIGLKSKASYQRRNIQARLDDHGVVDTFDARTDSRTESEMTYLMGGRRIFDCGKKRWEWRSTY